MTEQERQLISALAERIQNAPAADIDREADDLIRRTVGSRPDALYILTQTVLIQELALKQANAQLEQLKSAPQSQTSFLPQQQQGYRQDPSYQNPPAQNPQYQQSYAPPPPQGGGGFFGGGGGGGLGGFLRSAATTAAGVVAGQVAFDSLASMFGRHSSGGFFSGGGMGISPGSETIINNYYDDQGSGLGGGESRFDQIASQDQDISSDIQDERGNSGDDFSGSGDDSPDDGSSWDSGNDGSTDV